MKQLYIHTIGCQMNVYDSGQIAALLVPLGYRLTSQLTSADLIVVNTCAIRAKAEQKVFSFLGRLAALKRRRKALRIAVGGCVAQQQGAAILARQPCVDLVFGTQALQRLPRLVAAVEAGARRLTDIETAPATQIGGRFPAVARSGAPSRFVTVMRGCDNYCTYCVVPYVRGREASRPPDHILSEINAMVVDGACEVTLLGQNVNSYGLKEGWCSFAGLLARVNAVEGLSRIRFTTSHPKDLSDALIAAFRDLGKVCPHLHLPVQSGADRILKKMNRRYTRDGYLRKIERIRRMVPGIALTTDIIVGFPGEGRADFEKTLDLVRTVQYDALFAFIYSDRPQAPAARFAEKISEEEKKDRLRQVLDLQEGITRRKNEALVGTTQTLLVEGISKRKDAPGDESGLVQYHGRTPTNRIVHFPAPVDAGLQPVLVPGLLVEVRIEGAYAHSLRGRLLSIQAPLKRAKGGTCHAA